MARLAPSLVRLRATIDARWPNRDRTSDGWIGDAQHQGRVSDHNPNSRGIVDAIDVDKDGIHMPTLIAVCLVHPATHYVIHNRRIYTREVDHFRPRVYTGDNPHTGHLHESIRQAVSAEQDPTPWSLIAKAPSWPILRQGSTGRDVAECQAYLNGQGASLMVDGVFGAGTDQAVRAFQRRVRIRVDGLVGPATRSKLRTA